MIKSLNHLALLGLVFMAGPALRSGEVSQAATIAHSTKAAKTAIDTQLPSNSEQTYSEDYKKGYEDGLADARRYNCLRSPAWRPRAWWERIKMEGYFDGTEAAYGEVCGSNRSREKAPIY